jgi:transposase, IS5 family
MLQDSYETDKYFEHIISQLMIELEPVLAEIDQLLEDEELYQLIRNDLAKRYPQTEVTGRKSTPVEVIIRILAVKRLYGLSYEKVERQVSDSLVLRLFCRVYFNEVPDDTTLIRWANEIEAETLKAFNRRLTELATGLKVTKGRKLRTDGTVVESNIHSPSDSSLLVDGVRVIGRTLSRAREVLEETSSLNKAEFRNRIRSARRLARQIGEAMRKRSETAKEKGVETYRKLVSVAQETIKQAEKVMAELRTQATSQTEKLTKTLETFIPPMEQVVEQTIRRVFQGEQVPATEKIVSLFEPHTSIICRNKPRKPVEYGHKIWIDEVDGGIVTRWEVLQGNPNDTSQWTPSLENHVQLFGKPPVQASADRGVYSAPNEQKAKDLGVKHVILPKPGYKSEDRKQFENQRWFKQGRKWHNGVEGRISVLKRSFDIDRCLDHGEDGFDKWVGWGVIANNLRNIGHALTAKSG